MSTISGAGSANPLSGQDLAIAALVAATSSELRTVLAVYAALRTSEDSAG